MQQQIVTRGFCFVDTTIDNLFYVSIELGISAANSTHTAVVYTLTSGDRVRTRFNWPWAGDADGTSFTGTTRWNEQQHRATGINDTDANDEEFSPKILDDKILPRLFLSSDQSCRMPAILMINSSRDQLIGSACPGPAPLSLSRSPGRLVVFRSRHS